VKLEKYLTPEVIAGGLTAVLGALALASRESTSGADVMPKGEPEPDPDPVPWSPPPGELEGMGVSIRSLNHTDLLAWAGRFDGKALAEWCVQNNVRWVELLACWITKLGTTKRYLPHAKTVAVVDELRAAGVKVGIWGWPSPVNTPLYIQRMTEAAELVGAEWIKHNPEAPYHSKGISGFSRAQREDSAAAVMAWSTAMLPTDVTSYGSGPKSHGAFPWEQWADGARYGRPQWYDRDSDWSNAKVKSFADSWRTRFDTLCPVLSAVNSNTPAMMLDEANRFLPVADGPAFSYWDFYWLAISGKRTAAARKNGARYGAA